MKILKIINPNIKKSIKKLNNFTTNKNQTFNNLKNIIKILNQLKKKHK